MTLNLSEYVGLGDLIVERTDACAPSMLRRLLNDIWTPSRVMEHAGRMLRMDGWADDDMEENFWPTVAYEAGVSYAGWAWLLAMKAIGQVALTATEHGYARQDGTWDTSFYPGMLAESGMMEYYLTPSADDETGWDIPQSVWTDSVLASWRIFNYCSECDESYPSLESCPNEAYCDHCEEYFHGDEDEHMEGCTEECSCLSCRNRRLGDPEDDQGFNEELPERPPATAPEGRRRFGIEVEYNGGNRAEVVRHALNRGVAIAERGYTHETVQYWKLVDDSSVTGGEVVSPIMVGDDESIEQVLDVLRAVKQAGGRTGSNCGMHVHIDVTDFDRDALRTLAVNLQRTQRALEGFCADSRFNGENSHCEQFELHDWDEIHEWLGDFSDSFSPHRSRDNREESCPVDRYKGLNFNSLLTYGTIEVRLLGHTLNTVKVRAWIRILQSLFVASMRGHKIRRGTDFLDWLAEHGDLDEWAATRYRDVMTSRSRPDDWLKAAA